MSETSSSRQYCPRCQFPQRVCLCEAIQPVTAHTRIIILQHPSEQKVAKNTARLLQLSLAHCTVAIGETPADFAGVMQNLGNDCALLYPCDNSKALIPTVSHQIRTLLLLDGTWKKAYKLWQLNPWLWNLPAYHLHQPPAGIYQRKAKGAQQLSTLEACAFALQTIEQIDCNPLLQLLQARQDMGF